MPELPEVETIVRALEPEVTGREVIALELLHPRVYRNSDRERLCEVAKGAIITALRRRGKYIVFELSSGRPALIVHLGMSGQLLLSGEPLDNPHTRAAFKLSGRKFLNFVDIRTFGTLFLLEGKTPAGFRNLGVEPLSSGFSASSFGELLKGRSTDIKTLLLRQDLIAGIGNIYASEALFRARIHPVVTGKDLPPGRIRLLHRTLRKILREAIGQMGTTLSDFRRPDGTPGNFSNSLKVYGRKGQPCPRCGAEIERMIQHGRSTFYCLRCQH